MCIRDRIHVERAGIGQHGTIGGGLARSDVELLDHRGALICSGSLVRQINMNPLIAICRIEVMRHLDLLDIIRAVFHSHSGISGLVLLDGGSQTFGGVPGASHFNTDVYKRQFMYWLLSAVPYLRCGAVCC